MPLLNPLPYWLPKSPENQIMRSLDDYSPQELSTIQQNYPNHFSRVIKPNPDELTSNSEVRKQWQQFLNQDLYRSSKTPKIYFLKITNTHIDYFGFLCGLSTTDFKSGAITSHEKTYIQRVQYMAQYLETVQIQAEPVVVIHEEAPPKELLLENFEERTNDFSFNFEKSKYQLWQLSPHEVSLLQNWSLEKAYFHLADGHHRTACMIYLAEKKQTQLNVSSFLIHQDQIRLHSFVWFLDRALSKVEFEFLRQAIEINQGEVISINSVENNEYPLILMLNSIYYGFRSKNIQSENVPEFIHQTFLKSLPQLKNQLKYVPDIEINKKKIHPNLLCSGCNH
ncbi:MAG: DUF1015 family protein [Flavobacteriaceae bacterium]